MGVFNGSPRGCERADRVDFASLVRLELMGTHMSSDGGLLVLRDLDDTFGLSELS